MTQPGQENPPPAPPTQAVQLPPVPPPPPGAPQPGPQHPPAGGPAAPPPYQGWGADQPAQPYQGQPYQGQPYQGQPGQPYPGQGAPPQQPGQPPYQAWGPGQVPSGPVVVPKSSGKKKWASIAGAVVIAGGVLALKVGVLGALFDNEPDIGDCVHSTSGGSFETVDCDSADAQYKIIGKESGKSTFEDYQADQTTCSQFPDATVAGWYGAEGEEGTVYCAKDN